MPARFNHEGHSTFVYFTFHESIKHAYFKYTIGKYCGRTYFSWGGGSKFIPMEDHTWQPNEGKFFVWSVAKLKHFSNQERGRGGS